MAVRRSSQSSMFFWRSVASLLMASWVDLIQPRWPSLPRALSSTEPTDWPALLIRFATPSGSAAICLPNAPASKVYRPSRVRLTPSWLSVAVVPVVNTEPRPDRSLISERTLESPVSGLLFLLTVSYADDFAIRSSDAFSASTSDFTFADEPDTSRPTESWTSVPGAAFWRLRVTPGSRSVMVFDGRVTVSEPIDTTASLAGFVVVKPDASAARSPVPVRSSALALPALAADSTSRAGSLPLPRSTAAALAGPP